MKHWCVKGNKFCTWLDSLKLFWWFKFLFVEKWNLVQTCTCIVYRIHSVMFISCSYYHYNLTCYCRRSLLPNCQLCLLVLNYISFLLCTCKNSKWSPFMLSQDAWEWIHNVVHATFCSFISSCFIYKGTLEVCFLPEAEVFCPFESQGLLICQSPSAKKGPLHKHCCLWTFLSWMCD